MKLSKLYKKHNGNISDKWQLYLRVYDEIFEGLKDKSIRLLEIGVQNGGSLEIWGKYFSNAQLILGCDIDERCSHIKFDDDRIKIVIGDAKDKKTFDSVISYSDRFNLIIDDGSHVSGDIVANFFRYFPILEYKGIYVAEDMHCSYWDEMEGGLEYRYSSMEFFRRLTDIINFEHFSQRDRFKYSSRRNLVEDFICRYNIEVDYEDIEKVLDSIRSVQFFNSLCIITKDLPERNKLGKRIIAGEKATVNNEVLKHR